MDHYQAADQIAADLRAGSVEPYCQGDQAQQYLGDIFKAGDVGYINGESPSQHLLRSYRLMGERAAAIFAELAHHEDNLCAVLDEARQATRNGRSEDRELTLERSSAISAQVQTEARGAA